MPAHAVDACAEYTARVALAQFEFLDTHPQPAPYYIPKVHLGARHVPRCMWFRGEKW